MKQERVDLQRHQRFDRRTTKSLSINNGSGWSCYPDERGLIV
jgi:hypothetical protein